MAIHRSMPFIYRKISYASREMVLILLGKYFGYCSAFIIHESYILRQLQIHVKEWGWREGDHVADSKYISLTREFILRMENAQPLNDLRGAMDAALVNTNGSSRPINNSIFIVTTSLYKNYKAQTDML